MKLEAKEENKTKDLYFQWIRGICILVVVLIHCKASSATQSGELAYWIVLRQMTNFAVATFVFMAGYFAKPYKISGGYWTRLVKLTIPYLLWSLFYCLANGVVSPLEIITRMAKGTASVQLYYMVVIIELTVLTPLLWKTTGHNLISHVILMITPFYLIIICLLQYSSGFVISMKGRDFAAWITFYYIGMLAQKCGWESKMRLSRAAMCVLAALALSILEGTVVFRTLGNTSMAISQLKVSSFLFALAVINLVMLLHNEMKVDNKNWLVGVGNISFGIFFIHPFIIHCENYVLGLLGISELIPLPIYHLSQVSLTVIICCLLIGMIRKIDENGKISWMIGVVPAREK